MNRIPTDDEIRQQVQDMRRTDNLWDAFEADVLEIARAARIATGGDGHKSSHGALGGGGGGMKVLDEETGDEIKVAATVVETMALNAPQTDPMDRQCELLFDMLNQGAASSRAAFNTRDRIKKARTWVKPAGHTVTPCKVEGCDGPAVARGWCDPCRKWISRNPTADGLDPVTVPASVIGERTKRREKVA